MSPGATISSLILRKKSRRISESDPVLRRVSSGAEDERMDVGAKER